MNIKLRWHPTDESMVEMYEADEDKLMCVFHEDVLIGHNIYELMANQTVNHDFLFCEIKPVRAE